MGSRDVCYNNSSTTHIEILAKNLTSHAVFRKECVSVPTKLRYSYSFTFDALYNSLYTYPLY